MTWDRKKTPQAKDGSADAPAADNAEHAWSYSRGRKRRQADFADAEGRDGLAWCPARVDSTGRPRRFSAELLAGDEYECAFCRGKGRSGMGGQCPVCHGNGTVHLHPPAVRCAFCQGRGQVPPRSQLTCCVCRGKGVVPVRGPVQVCPKCGGRGRKSGEALYCARCVGTGVITSPQRSAKTEGDSAFIRALVK